MILKMNTSMRAPWNRSSSSGTIDSRTPAGQHQKIVRRIRRDGFENERPKKGENAVCEIKNSVKRSRAILGRNPARDNRMWVALNHACGEAS